MRLILATRCPPVGMPEGGQPVLERWRVALRSLYALTRTKVTAASCIRIVVGSTMLAGSALSNAEVLVLSYHHIGAPGFLTVSVSAETLRRQIRYLQGAGYTFTPLSDAVAGSADSKLVAITFDDGYQDVYHNAFPVLRNLGVTATVFVVTDFVGRDEFVSWPQLEELSRAGWQVASHGADHRALTDLTPATIAGQLAAARAALEAHLPEIGSCFSYPYGRHDARVRRIVADHHDCALTTAYGLNDPHTDRGAYRRPLFAPWDEQSYARQATGLDARAFLFAPALGSWVFASQDPAGMAAPFYQPARYELMGDGELAFRYHAGSYHQSFFYREGAFAVTGTASRFGSSYSEISAVWSTGIANIGVGASNLGPLLAVAVPLQGHGEVWVEGGPNRHLTVGAQLVPADDVRVQLEYHRERGLSGEIGYALPINAAEGHPYRVFGGYSRQPYAGVRVRLGSMELDGAITTTGQLNFGMTFSW